MAYYADYENVCPHNNEVVCRTAKCDRCGWNPEVAKARLDEYVGGMVELPADKLYHIPFTGYCDVWAKSPEEALERAEDEKMFTVGYEFGTPECLTKEEKNEVD